MGARIGVRAVARTLSKLLRKMGLGRATRNESSTTTADGAPVGDANDLRRKPLPFAWKLFIAVWLLFPIGFVVQALRSDLSPVQLLALLASLVVFISIF